MKFFDINITNRPPFMMLVEETGQPYINGYTLLVDVDTKQASIINLIKGGKVTMLKEIRKARAGYESIVELLEQKKAHLEDEKAEAIKVAVAEVEKRFAEDSEHIDRMYEESTIVEQVEVPDEEFETHEAEELVNAEVVEAEHNTIDF